MGDFPNVGHADQLTIGRLLERPLRWSPGQAIVYRNFQYTYADMARRVRRLASLLAGLGVKPGDPVGFMDWDSHRYLEAYFAVPMMGRCCTRSTSALARADPFTHEPRGGRVLLVTPRLPADPRADPRAGSHGPHHRR